jgi:uncharacterized membrane protein YgcG
VTVLLPLAEGAPLAPELLQLLLPHGGTGKARAATAATVIGVRVPQCEFTRAVARELGGALVLVSAVDSSSDGSGGGGGGSNSSGSGSGRGQEALELLECG